MSSDQKVLECLKCQHCRSVYSKTRLPISVPHSVVCQPCLHELINIPTHKIHIPKDADSYPFNSTLLSILNIESNNTLSDKYSKTEFKHADKIESYLISLADILFISTSEFNENLSKFVQKRLLQIFNLNLYLNEARNVTVKHCKLLVERIVTELVLSRQTSAHISSCLWSAVRARGCQFLGPAMQDAVLTLIIKALQNGELIARKQLVLYIVDSMIDKYPQISKTCVGHVVQLLYRASCFNVIKRDGESSLMQLKEEFREYQNLRKEHDFQIVQIASEAGLRISPDQWSTLLYGDPFHRPQMEKTIERLNEPITLTQNETAALQTILMDTHENNDANPNEYLNAITEILLFDTADRIQLADLDKLLKNLLLIVEKYSKIYKSKPSDATPPRKDLKQNGPAPPQRMYKTRFCRDVLVGRPCPRGERCTYAHASNEIRPNNQAQNEDQTLQNPQQPLPPALTTSGTTINQPPVDQLAMQFNDMIMEPPIQPPPVLLQSSDMEQPIVLDNGLAHAAAAAAANGQAPPVVVPVIMNHHDMNSGIVQPALTHALMFPNDDPATGATLVLPNANTPAVQPVPTTANIQPIDTPIQPVPTMAEPMPPAGFGMVPNPVLFSNQQPIPPSQQPLMNGMNQSMQMQPNPQMNPGMPIQPMPPPINQPPNQLIPNPFASPPMGSIPLPTTIGQQIKPIPATVNTPVFFNNQPSANFWLPQEP